MPGWSRPDASASRELKEKWIKAKYEWRGFVQLPPRGADGRAADQAGPLLAAAAAGDVLGCLQAILCGAPLPTAGGTALRAALDGGHLDVCELLALHDVQVAEALEGGLPARALANAAAARWARDRRRD
jgi:hypothetical protein